MADTISLIESRTENQTSITPSLFIPTAKSQPESNEESRHNEVDLGSILPHPSAVVTCWSLERELHLRLLLAVVVMDASERDVELLPRRRVDAHHCLFGSLRWKLEVEVHRLGHASQVGEGAPEVLKQETKPHLVS